MEVLLALQIGGATYFRVPDTVHAEAWRGRCLVEATPFIILVLANAIAETKGANQQKKEEAQRGRGVP
jgi:hypothetical protein